MNGNRALERCESCGEPYEPHLGRDGACFTCTTHLGCACADEPEADTRELPQHSAGRLRSAALHHPRARVSDPVRRRQR